MAGLVIKDKSMYMLADQQYYEPLSRYKTQEHDFNLGLQRRLPPGWELYRSEIWTHCSFQGASHPDQGWKIHLSATPAYAPAILTTASKILFDEGVAFKFVADRTLLFLSLSKRWSRGGSGKFMAIYPEDEVQCAKLLEMLHKATIGYNGPYILSDRRYKNSKVVYYRYGGLKGIREYHPDGTYTLKIKDSSGNYVDDQRSPFFFLSEDMDDPFQPDGNKAHTGEDEGEDGTLADGRYEVIDALTFSVSGGVYKALDRQSGETVVIKEGRPFTNVSTRGLDAVQSLKKEHRILCEIADLGIAPKPIDFFLDWEHAYLVEEYLEGAQDFRSYLSRMMLSLMTAPTQADSQAYIDIFCSIFDQLLTAMSALHDRNIVFGDLSMANILISDTESGLKVRLIDFEGAHETNVDIPSHIFTIGFSAIAEDERSTTNQSDDYYALGSLMLAGLFPINQFLVLDRAAVGRWLDSLSRDFAIPRAIQSAILNLLGRRVTRTGLLRIRDSMRSGFVLPPPSLDTHQLDSTDVGQALAETVEYIIHSASPDRRDRLFPADPEVFSTNPMGVAYGACGVAMVLQRVLGHVPEHITSWMHGQRLDAGNYPPGLYNGLSGIAWTWLEMADEDRAMHALSLADGSRMLAKSPDMYNGLAGWGLTHLRFHRHFGESRHLDVAVKAGDDILASREQIDPSSCRWTSGEELCAGYGHGAAGISDYLLDLYKLTGEKRFLDVAAQGLAWVQSVAIDNGSSGLSWRAKEDIPSIVPYMRWGSSGIARAFIKLRNTTGDDQYDSVIEKAIADCTRKYTIFSGYSFGLAGLVDFMLDIIDDPRWHDSAKIAIERNLSGLLLFGISTDHGLAFPGDGLARISCDFATGSAGVAYALHRYVDRGPAILRL